MGEILTTGVIGWGELTVDCRFAITEWGCASSHRIFIFLVDHVHIDGLRLGKATLHSSGSLCLLDFLEQIFADVASAIVGVLEHPRVVDGSRVIRVQIITALCSSIWANSRQGFVMVEAFLDELQVLCCFVDVWRHSQSLSQSSDLIMVGVGMVQLTVVDKVDACSHWAYFVLILPHVLLWQQIGKTVFQLYILVRLLRSASKEPTVVVQNWLAHFDIFSHFHCFEVVSRFKTINFVPFINAGNFQKTRR